MGKIPRKWTDSAGSAQFPALHRFRCVRLASLREQGFPERSVESAGMTCFSDWNHRNVHSNHSWILPHLHKGPRQRPTFLRKHCFATLSGTMHRSSNGADILHTFSYAQRMTCMRASNLPQLEWWHLPTMCKTNRRWHSTSTHNREKQNKTKPMAGPRTPLPSHTGDDYGTTARSVNEVLPGHTVFLGDKIN